MNSSATPQVLIKKLKGLTGISPRVISTEPVFIQDDHIYYCTTTLQHDIPQFLDAYDTLEWGEPKKYFHQMEANERNGIQKGLKWLQKDNFGALFLTRNMMILD